MLRGQPFDQVVSDCREKFWPLIFAGQKLWPAVSVVCFTLIPVERRNVFGSVIGLFWGIYLSLMSSSDR